MEKINLANTKILLFSGNWCPMCRADVPKILLHLSNLEIGTETLETIEVNGYKTEPKELIEKHKIRRVPTLVFYNNDIEIGRITEFPTTTWANDIDTILAKI